ncbi:RNA-guided endonuclease InsQ/TnpB family protein [Paenibacillus daejeonensis]|uniref:RNA-guided endonuclease InsQ/TnpB family protein n=1 Tax=Paenibacillus daejeonensis TaxID=135193 RepID=UPI00037A69B9|nr:RNA-guided endonuclease TnpB family protein [Paenibacillus daejeonensis]
MSDPLFMYRTYHVWIKPGHRLFAYLDEACQCAKNLYNMANFYLRQVFTAKGQQTGGQPLQQLVMATLSAHLDAMNERRRASNRSRPFVLPTPEQPFLSYAFLDALFKVMEQPDYRSLAAQSSQGILKLVFQNWASFFASMKDYRKHPEKYTGKPNLPGYARGQVKDVVFSNQDCVIKKGRYLKLPRTKLQLNIGKLGAADGKLMQVRVLPRHGHYLVELVFACPQRQQASEMELRLNVRPADAYMAIDLGVNNLATIVTTTGAQPLIVKGGMAKATNQYYNKMKAYYTGILRQGKAPQEGLHTSKRLERLHRKRYCRIKDLFHKTSYHIVKLAEKQGIGTLIIGQNKGWKQASGMGRQTNQTFCHLPHRQLISMIQYKAEEKGMTVILTEEAYTSKASFLDQDPLPRFDEPPPAAFSGKRIHRGLYASLAGLINADVNGAANIMRKVFPNVTAKHTNGVEGLDGNQTVNVSTPRRLSILRTSG